MNTISNDILTKRANVARDLIPLLSDAELTIACLVFERPSMSDGEISVLLGISKSLVGRRRRTIGIPSLFEPPYQRHEVRKWIESDNIDLENGICRVNLHGEEQQRYLAIYNRKVQKDSRCNCLR